MFKRRLRSLLAVLAATAATAAPAAAQQDQVYFASNTNVTNILVNYINQETVRLDVSSWYLSEHSISIAILNRFKAGVPVRLMGDRGAIFEADPHTKSEFYWLAAQGVPIRLRFNPTWFPEIDHWKMAIFAGQNMVEFGSGNFAPTELAPYCAQGSTTCTPNYDDDAEMFTTDPVLVGAFKTKFDVMWNDTTVETQSIISGPPYFKDWNDACANEPTGNCSDYANYYATFPGGGTPMVVNTARLEPDNPMPADMIWGQGSQFESRLIQEVNNENAHIDFVIYRLEDGSLMQALLDKFNAGVPLRIIVDPDQYTNNVWPEYWMTHANIDKLWAAGVPIKQRTHQGLTHLKTLITSTYATNASSNFGPNWQRDHNYFVSASTKPTIYQAYLADMNSMWNDTTDFGPLVPTGPQAVDTTAPDTVPQPAQTNVPVTTTFTWHRAAWAALYDVYLGTSPSNLTLTATVAAQLVTDPPLTYSWTPSSPLNFGTTYYWKVVSRTFAGLTASSSTFSFSTPAAGSQPPTAPANPTPGSGASGVGTTPMLAWSSVGANSYAINFGTTNPPPSTGTSTTAASYSPGTLTSNTTYYWQIVASNGAGSTPGPIWSFSTSSSNLPAPWQSQDVGATGQAGSSTVASGTYTVSGAGADIWGSADAFQFAYQTLTGDGVIVAHITSVQNTSPYAKAGLMMRDSTAANAAHVIIDLRPTGDIEFMTRQTDGGSTSWLSGAVQAAPVWLKLQRTGSSITGYESTDGSTWTQVGTTTITLPSTIDTGLLVTSHDTTTLNTSIFDNVSINTSGPLPGTPASPSPADTATAIALSPTLTWTSTNATSYDIAFGTTNPPPLASPGQTTASYAPGALDQSTTYFWRITAKNSSGSTVGPVWSFTTQSAPAAPSSPSPASGATGVTTTPTLMWTSSGATTYDVAFGTGNPPPAVATGQASATYTPSALASSTMYFWQITAHNSVGTTVGPVWSFTTQAPAPPAAPSSPNPASAATGVSTTPTLTWTSSGATSYDVKFGTSTPPPAASSGQAGASYTTPTLSSSTTYYWQIVANNVSGSTPGPIWSFTTGAAPVTDNVVIYAADIPSANFHGAWTTASDTTAAAGLVAMTPDAGVSNTAAPIASPSSYVDVPFTASAGTQYTLWLRVKAIANSKYNDSFYVQFSDAQSGGSPIFALGSTSALVVNLATDSTGGSDQNWGWVNGAYWLTQPATFTFAASGAHTLRIQTREDGAEIDQIVLSPVQFFDASASCPNTCGGAPGPVSNDSTIVPKPAPPSAPGTPASPSPVSAATNVSTTPTLTWSSNGATSYDIAFGTTNPPGTVSTGQVTASYSPSALNNSTTYYWQITAHNSAGATVGPIWSFTTQAPSAPGAPSSPNPSSGATAVGLNPVLTWTAVSATSYDVKFGTTNPPSTVSTGQSAASYSPSTLSAATTYYWQIVAKNSGGSTAGPVWSFTTMAAPGAPASPSPADAAAGVSRSPTLSWTAANATTYDVKFGTTNPPSTVSAAQTSASYSPSALSYSTTYYWQIVANNGAGSTTGPVWSFTTMAAPPPPTAPSNPNPASAATGVSTTPTLNWTASTGASTYDVKFGTANPPPTVSTAQSGTSFTPSAALSNGTTYFWQVIATNGSGSTAGPVWSFTTAASATPTDIVIYAADIPSANYHGSFTTGSDATAAAGLAALTPDAGVSQTSGPLASPTSYVDVPFTANSGVAYTLWIRMKAAGNSKYNDSFFVQFSDALASGSPIDALNTTQGLTVNLATDSTASSDNNWGWVNGAYWLSQPATFTFASSGAHTLRIQVREDGFSIDQIVLSPSTFFNSSASCPTSCAGAPGGVTNDSTIVPKP